ncbi:MAG TPA: TAT-variant-translocated molybdopterin oxidoreductase, partial [Opitutaceae bacterium]|nr:TAT-variant-translocated molybdopterin oxidoreductase [Opitutaceae bacterium]
MKREFHHPAPSERELAGPKYWRSLDELAETPGFKAQLEREFPEGASELAGVDRRQELPRDPDGVIPVLVRGPAVRLPVPVAVPAGGDERPDHALGLHLALDEVLDVGVGDVEHVHLGCPAAGAAGLRDASAP